MRRSWVLACVTLLVAASCGSSAEPAGSPRELTGVVVKVDSQGLGEVTSFELRSKGTVHEIFINPRVVYGFNPDHLSGHLASGDPVRVEVREEEGKLVATAMDDA